MPVQRALLSGLGDALTSFADEGVKRREHQRVLAEQHAFAMQQAQLAAFLGLNDKITTDPLAAHRLLAGAEHNPLLAQLGPLLQQMQPDDPTLVAELQRKIQGVDKPLDMPNIATEAARAGLDTAQVPATAPSAPVIPGAPPVDVRGAAAGAAGPVQTLHPDELPGSVPDAAAPVTPGKLVPNIAAPDDVLAKLKAQFPHNNPNLETLQGAAQQRKTALRVGEEDKLALDARGEFMKAYQGAAGKGEFENENIDQQVANTQRIATAQTYGSKKGEQAAGDEHYDEDLRQTLNTLKLKGPIEAMNAGMSAGAVFDSMHTADRMRIAVEMDRLKAEAEAGAREGVKQRLRDAGFVDEQQQQAALQLSDDYRQQSQDFMRKEAAYRTVLATAKETLAKPGAVPTPADSLAMIFAYMKTLDSLSGVQKGEQLTAQQARSLGDELTAQYNKVRHGALLTAQQMRDFSHSAYGQYQAAKGQQVNTINQYSARADGLNVPRQLVVGGLDPTLDTDPTSGAKAEPVKTLPAPTPRVRPNFGSPAPGGAPPPVTPSAAGGIVRIGMDGKPLPPRP